MLVPLLISVVASVDGGVPDASVTTLDAGPDRLGELFQAQAWLLADCAPHVDGGAQTVSFDFKAGLDGGDFVHLVGEPSTLGRCAHVFANAFQFPPDLGVRRAQSFVISRDGGVESRTYAGGGVDKRDLHVVIKSHQHEVRFCFEKRLQTQPGLAGKLKIAWSIGVDGTVVETSVLEDTVPDPLVARCVLDRVKTWRFREPINGGRVNVTFPYIFVPEGASEAQPQEDELSPSLPRRRGTP